MPMQSPDDQHFRSLQMLLGLMNRACPSGDSGNIYSPRARCEQTVDTNGRRIIFFFSFHFFPSKGRGPDVLGAAERAVLLPSRHNGAQWCETELSTASIDSRCVAFRALLNSCKHRPGGLSTGPTIPNER